MTRPEGRLYVPLVWTSSAALFVSGCALLILMLTATIGPFRFQAMSLDESREAFGLWVPAGDQLPGEVAVRVHAWRSIAPRDRGFVESDSLEELTHAEVAALAIADARSLSRSDAAALRAFMSAGGGVVLTGSIGVRGPQGEWRGYELMERLLEVDQIVPLANDQSSGLRAYGRGPLSAPLEPGERIPLIAEPGVPTLDTAPSELRWAPADPDARSYAASTRLHHGRGRLVWIAAGPESAVVGGGDPWLPMVKLFHSAIEWSAGRPILEVLPWPDGAPFAGRVELARAAPEGTIVPTTPTKVAQSLRRSITTAKSTAGFARLTIPADALSKDAIDSLESLGREELQRNGSWLVRSGQVASWKSTRSAIDARYERTGPRRLLIRITNRSREQASGVVLRVHLSQPALDATLAGTTLLQRQPELRLQSGDEWIDLVLPKLPGRSNHAYTLDYLTRDTG